MGRGTNLGDSNLKLFFMKITGVKEGEKITIKQSEARGKGNIVELDETVQDVSGQLTKVEVREYSPKEGEKARELKVWLRDSEAGELYAVGCNMNSIGRSILNTILSLEPPFGELVIRVYNKKEGKNYAAVYITHNGVKVGWKYSLDEQKEHIVETPVKKNGVTKIERDFWELDSFLIKDLNANIAPKLAALTVSEQKAPSQTREFAPIETLASDIEAPAEVGEEDSDLPEFLRN